MKRLLYISFILATASCKKDRLLTYNAPDNIYFNYINSNIPFDSVNLSFAYRDAGVKDTILLVPIAVTGIPATKDRRYSLIADPASTAIAGTHFELPETVIHAGKLTDTLRLHLNRTADLTSGIKKLILRLQPDEQFKTDIKYKLNNASTRDTTDLLSFTIIISDFLDKGPYWDDYAPFFGTFSIKKVKFINDLLGMPLDFWSVPADNLRRSAATYYASTTSRYLSDQAAQGNIIYDDDGTPMQMGAGY